MSKKKTNAKKQPAPTPIVWADFMNGYRDPLTHEETVNRLRAEHKENGEKQALRDYIKKAMEEFTGGGGGDFGGGDARECGYRKEGGTYAVCPTTSIYSGNGRPLEYFIVCKPRPIDADEYGLANVGVKLIDLEETCSVCNGSKFERATLSCRTCSGTGKETVTHVLDVVGAENYFNVADFLEEARRLGVSRRLELGDSKEYGRLSKRSRLMLLHSKAVILNAPEIISGMGEVERKRLNRAGCPKDVPTHPIPLINTKTPFTDYPPGCSSLYWNLLAGDKLQTIPEERGGFYPLRLM